MATEQPRFESIERINDVELRLYAPMVIAETWVTGPMDDAMNRGFGLIAGYIFGKNASRNGRQATKIAMTSPVTVDAGPETIAMTTPVTMESRDGKWRVYFVMPAQYTLASLPIPADSRVSLRQLPAQKVAAISFSGFAGEEKVLENATRLLSVLQAQGLHADSGPRLARYDPPWTLPFLRHNEVLVNFR